MERPNAVRAGVSPEAHELPGPREIVNRHHRIDRSREEDDRTQDHHPAAYITEERISEEAASVASKAEAQVDQDGGRDQQHYSLEKIRNLIRPVRRTQLVATPRSDRGKLDLPRYRTSLLVEDVPSLSSGSDIGVPESSLNHSHRRGGRWSAKS